MTRPANVLDFQVRRHLAMLVTGIQSADDDTALRLARTEIDRLAAGVIAGLRSHHLDRSGTCVLCGTYCRLRVAVSDVLLPTDQERSSP
ncbi:hypothetical protein [Kibdelosporangium persicum]|uniref:hypothetical protein n=1 Tax=Kibdelosporangium persicum TaxID=2698649 RepID=UPI001565BC62|nr:hypothetical protein [Kibdelosporangium persicum]